MEKTIRFQCADTKIPCTSKGSYENPYGKISLDPHRILKAFTKMKNAYDIAIPGQQRLTFIFYCNGKKIFDKQTGVYKTTIKLQQKNISRIELGKIINGVYIYLFKREPHNMSLLNVVYSSLEKTCIVNMENETYNYISWQVLPPVSSWNRIEEPFRHMITYSP